MTQSKNIQEFFKRFDIGKFDSFMESIISDYVLVVNGEKYRFAEIELYYKSSNHNDYRVFKRAGKNAGDIFFHQYGFDVCFQSDDATYGGVLVRSLKNMQTNEFIRGPLRCSHELLNKHVPCVKFESKYDPNKQEIEKTARIRGKCNNQYSDKKYRYVLTELS